MVSPQATHNDKPSHPTDWRPRSGDDSVRITAEVRRQVLVEFLTDALTVQRAKTEGERIDRAATESASPHGFFSTADLRVSNAAAVQQWIASSLAGYTDNRDFVGQVAK